VQYVDTTRSMACGGVEDKCAAFRYGDLEDIEE